MDVFGCRVLSCVSERWMDEMVQGMQANVRDELFGGDGALAAQEQNGRVMNERHVNHLLTGSFPAEASTPRSNTKLDRQDKLPDDPDLDGVSPTEPLEALGKDNALEDVEAVDVAPETDLEGSSMEISIRDAVIREQRGNLTATVVRH